MHTEWSQKIVFGYYSVDVDAVRMQVGSASWAE